jgi:hypothetical protein
MSRTPACASLAIACARGVCEGCGCACGAPGRLVDSLETRAARWHMCQLAPLWDSPAPVEVQGAFERCELAHAPVQVQSCPRAARAAHRCVRAVVDEEADDGRPRRQHRGVLIQARLRTPRVQRCKRGRARAILWRGAV